jgi:hypothetical protein
MEGMNGVQRAFVALTVLGLLVLIVGLFAFAEL